MSNPLSRLFSILLSRKPSVDAALTSLAKRATKKGLPVLSWSWGKPVTAVEIVGDGEGEELSVTRCPLTLDGGEVKLAGWSFVAALQHMDGENLVRVLPGESLPTCFRAVGPACDHCKVSRRRHDTYVLRHDDGRVMQVGSTCLADFLGSDEAGKVAAQAEILAFAAAACGSDDDGFGGFGGGGPTERALAEYLPIVASCVTQGWASRTKAREVGGEATADVAWTLLTDARARDKRGVAVTDAEKATAAAAEAWAEALTDEAIAAETGDYLHNLRVIARSGLVSLRTAGIAASMVVAYQRAVARAREAAARPELDAFLGKVGDKVTFGLPPVVGKKGQPLKSSPIVLSLAPVTLDFVTGYETQFGYVTVLRFRTAEGATLVWKTGSETNLTREHVGKTFTVWGSVKSHDEYKGKKQTILTRCAVNEVEVALETAKEVAA